MVNKNKHSFIRSLGFALEGIYVAISREKHLKIHIIFGALALTCGIFFKISKIEWMILLMTIVLVIFAELFNTAIETTVDLFSKKKCTRAKLAKDVSAGAVLMVSVFAIVIGYFIFYNRFISLLGVN